MEQRFSLSETDSLRLRKDRLHRFGFILFSPDATTTGVYCDAIKIIRSQGLLFNAFLWTRLQPWQVNYIYEKNRKTSASGEYIHSLVDKLFSLDYSLACLVQAPYNFETQSVPAFLRDLKGPSDPRKLQPHHLRSMLGAGNKVLNFVHTSDTLEETQREAALFFPIMLDESNTESVKCANPPVDLGIRPSVSVFFTIVSIKSAVINKSPRCLSRLRKTIEREFALAVKRRKDRTNVEELYAIWNYQKQVIDKADDVPEIGRQVFNSLVSLPNCMWDEQHLTTCLTQIGVQLSEWDSLILRCQKLQGQLL